MPKNSLLNPSIACYLNDVLNIFVLRVMATIAEDVSYLHDVLLANGVEKRVDREMVRALLELYAGDSQRVDLVLLELEEMLGQQFEVRTQLQRYCSHELILLQTLLSILF